MNHDVMFSSKTDMWATPQWLFDELNERYHFTLDVCAVEENAKCANFYSPELDGLSQPWKGRVWCNPPYGRNIGKWVQKAADSDALVVMLLPARTDTRWFHDYIYGKADVKFLKGRLKFFWGGEKFGTVPKYGCDFQRRIGGMRNASSDSMRGIPD